MNRLTRTGLAICFAVLTTTTALALPQSQPCGQGAIVPYKWGQYWGELPKSGRVLWIEGFVSGQSHSFLTWERETGLSPVKREELRRKLFPIYDSDVLEPVITALYRDPANVFITPTGMLYIAKAQLNGDDTRLMLMDARRNDCSGSLPPR
ncbi:MAG: hypothetical protein U0Q55_15250 [Vicinamibacterales bacterium]